MPHFCLAGVVRSQQASKHCGIDQIVFWDRTFRYDVQYILDIMARSGVVCWWVSQSGMSD